MIRLIKIFSAVVFLITACVGEQQAETEEAASHAGNKMVVASNYPLYFFASRITENVDGAPDIILPEIDGDPAFWVPDVGQIQSLQSADLVLLNGAGAESWLNLITLDQRRLVDTSATLVDKLIPLTNEVQHQHGPEGNHSHQGTAFTTWLDPRLAIAQAQSITDSLIDIAPAIESELRSNMKVLEQDLLELDNELASVFAQVDSRPVLFSHPVYQYLQQRYSINGESVHWEPDEEPGTSAWIELQQILARHPARVMLWEAEPLERPGARLLEAGIKSVTFAPVANRPQEGDFLSVMQANAARLESIFQK